MRLSKNNLADILLELSTTIERFLKSGSSIDQDIIPPPTKLKKN